MLRAWQRTVCGKPVDGYAQGQDDLVEARNRLARAIAGAAMSGLTRDEIVDLTGYPADLVLRICREAGVTRRSRSRGRTPCRWG
jgi:hypothetical protein